MNKNHSERERIFIIDGYAILYRAHYALIRNPLITSYGLHTSALYGFINQIFNLIKSESPDFLVCAFDSKEKTFRHEIYNDYKANRSPMPEELQNQLPHLWQILELMNIPILKKAGFEADDIIGTIAQNAEKKGLDSFIVSGDKDFMQLITNHISMYSPGTRKTPHPVIFNPKKVEEKWGIPPNKIIDLLALMGDSADNIPGVSGVGEKTAVKLIKQFGSLESALENADKISNKRVNRGLKEDVENAKLSKKLARIHTSVELELNIEDFKTKKIQTNRTIEKFKELEFHAFVKQLQTVENKNIKNEKSNFSYEIINDGLKLDTFIQTMKNSDVISFNFLTDSLSVMDANIIGISFCTNINKNYYLPIAYKEKIENNFSDNDLIFILNKLKVIFEDEKILKVAHNAKNCSVILRNYEIKLKGLVFDSMLASHLLNPSTKLNTLDSVCLEYLNLELILIEELIGIGRKKIRLEMVELEKLAMFSCQDANLIFQLHPILEKKLVESGLSDYVNDIEIPLIEVLADMEFFGVFVEENKLKNISDRINTILEDLKKKIYNFSNEDFNINSTQQLAKILFDDLGLPQIKKRSTAEEVLKQLSLQHELPDHILGYRKYNKLKNTYLDSLPLQINTKTKRIHTTFNQTIAATGRLSSTNPNFQNIPIKTEEGREIRKAFIGQREGWKILSADYSQIELRVMAHFSEDSELVKSFNSDEDIHTRTASKVFNVGLKDVIPEMRRTAKVVNFGIMYGAGPFRMSQELGIPRKESVTIIDSYFNEYPGIKDYINSTIDYAKKHKFIKTINGRKRPVWDADSDNGLRRKAAERMAINMPIQGSAAEMIKIAMINIYKDLKSNKMRSKMFLQIHDELLFEFPIEEEEKLIEIVITRMENAMDLLVPLKVDYGIGNNWYEAH